MKPQLWVNPLSRMMSVPKLESNATATQSTPNMTNIKIEKSDANELEPWRRKYLDSTSAPLDGMWLSFAAMSDHYSFLIDEQVCGYCAVNSENKLLQFHVDSTTDKEKCFQLVLNELKITAANVSSAEIQFFELCKTHSSTEPALVDLMYHIPAGTLVERPHFPDGTDIEQISMYLLDSAVEFSVAALGADANWLKEYYVQRISDSELFGLWNASGLQERELIATGEFRPSQLQPQFADVGMIVAKQYRGQGIATNMLRWLIEKSRNSDKQPICSTSHDNRASQVAIERAGFAKYHEILQFSF